MRWPIIHKADAFQIAKNEHIRDVAL